MPQKPLDVNQYGIDDFTKTMFQTPSGLNLNNQGGASNAQNNVYSPDFSALQASWNEILKAYQGQEAALNAQYQTNLQASENAYAQLQKQLADKGLENKQSFQQARGTVSEDAFTRGRAINNALSARGLGNSGIQQLGQVQNRMETGRQVSGIADKFYDTNKSLADTSVNAQQTYETSKQQLQNSLAAALAQLLAQKGTATLDYKSTVEGFKQAASQSAQNAEANGLQTAANQNDAVANATFIATEDPTGATVQYPNRETKVQSIIAQYKNAGLTLTASDAQKMVNDAAVANYQAALAANKGGQAAKLRTAYIAQGYDASIFDKAAQKVSDNSTGNINPVSGEYKSTGNNFWDMFISIMKNSSQAGGIGR